MKPTTRSTEDIAELVEALRTAHLALMRGKDTRSENDFQRTEQLLEKHTKKEPKFKGPIWWHWVMEVCDKCEMQFSQGPVADEQGEDIYLFEKVEAYNDAQREGETDYRCSYCQGKLRLGYRLAAK